MSTQVFGRSYAQQYDGIYSEKDYEEECTLLEEAFLRYGPSAIRTALDLGCGTGNHSLVLWQRGYQVTGVDRSEEMLEQARAKVTALRGRVSTHPPEFVRDDVRRVKLGRTFDAALMMFAVLGYQLENDDVLSALRTARLHLRPGGLFLFDVWYGPAVLTIRPSNQVKEVSVGGAKLIRFSSAGLDVIHHKARVEIKTWKIGAPADEAETVESHDMRFFFPQELRLLMKLENMDLVHLSAFPKLERAPDERCWNVFGVARAI